MNFVSNDETLTSRVHRYFSRRKDIEILFEPVISFESDVNCVPAQTLIAYSDYSKIRLPVIAYGSHIFLRQAYLFGCTDFLKDPWTLEELEIRLDKIIASMRKNYSFSWGDLSFYGQGVSISGRDVILSGHELKIFRMLAEQRGSIVPRDALFYALWGKPDKSGSRVVDVHISSICRKIASAIGPQNGKKVIRAVRRMGYIIE